MDLRIAAIAGGAALGIGAGVVLATRLGEEEKDLAALLAETVDAHTSPRGAYSDFDRFLIVNAAIEGHRSLGETAAFVDTTEEILTNAEGFDNQRRAAVLQYTLRGSMPLEQYRSAARAALENMPRSEGWTSDERTRTIMRFGKAEAAGMDTPVFQVPPRKG